MDNELLRLLFQNEVCTTEASSNCRTYSINECDRSSSDKYRCDNTAITYQICYIHNTLPNDWGVYTNSSSIWR